MSEPVTCQCGGNHQLDWDAAVTFADGRGQQMVCMGDTINRVMAGEPITDLDRALFVTLMLRMIQYNYAVSRLNEAALASLTPAGRQDN